MAELLLNNFLLGADPEMVLLDPPTLIQGNAVQRTNGGKGGDLFYGFDHNGYVIEPHPTPTFSVRELCNNIKRSLAVISHHLPNYKQRAGAYHESQQRPVTLGGHVHLDIRKLSPQQIDAMDTFCQSLELLDILPSAECKKRTAAGHYGQKGDIRAEHGHVEYRSMCSWLFSRKTTMLSITGIKLAACAPGSITIMKSIKELQTWLEHFKGKDDDVDWILDKEYLRDSMEAKPDNEVAKVWKVDPKEGEGVVGAKLKEIEAKKKSSLRIMNGHLTTEALYTIRGDIQYGADVRELARQIVQLRYDIRQREEEGEAHGVLSRMEELRVAKLLALLQ